MKLLVHELMTTLEQQVTTNHRNILIEAIRPHIYKHANPSGSLSIKLKDLNDQTIASSNTLTISTIHTTGFSSATYGHGYIKFDIDAFLRKETTYKIVLEASGYTFSESAYIGWCNGFDLGKYDSTYSPNVGFSAALDLEIWERKQVLKA